MFISCQERGWRFQPLRDKEAEGGSGGTPAAGGEGEGGDGAPPAPSPQNTMFNQNTGEAEAPAPESEAPPEGEIPPDPDRPDWLLPKYKSAEDQAKAYRDLYGRFSKKTEDLKGEVREEFEREWAEQQGIPEDLDGYKVPEDLDFELYPDSRGR